jgi:DNA polymerase I-like protein with 3'-5' exonuclease and polymerase domains
MYVNRDWAWVPENGARKLLSTLHPSFILRAPSWRHVLQSDISKAFRWFNDCLRWTPPDSLINPTPKELEAWFEQSAPFWAYDVETDGIEPLECNLRTIAVAIPDIDRRGNAARNLIDQNARAVGVGLLSTDGVTRLYPPEQEKEIKDIFRRVFTDGRVWVGHNAGYYDRMVIEHHFGVTPRPLVDTLFHARFRAPDLPKGLKTVGSVLTDVERWETTEKGSKISTGSENDDELLRYNIVDTVVNARIVVPLVDAASECGAFRTIRNDLKPESWPTGRSWNLNEVDHETQEMCVEMHKNGVWVDQKLRGKLEAEYQLSVKQRFKKLARLVKEIGGNHLSEDSAGADDEINPGSAAQIRDLLYGRWKLSIPAQMDARDFYTESGLPGTGDAVLRGHMASGKLNDDQMAFIHELRLYRREKNKILGTTLIPLRRRDVDLKKGVVWEDGRVRSTWNAHVTSVGRLSSSGPNLQNQGSRKGQGRIKAIFAAPPGRLYIGADLDQAHLRITASYWQIPLLLECFQEGKDPHNTLAYATFGDKFKTASGWGSEGFSLYNKPEGGEAKDMRDVCKTLRYASIYGANPATAWQVITSTETGDGKLPYVSMTVREVRMMHEAWMKSEPQWAEAWERMMNTYKHQGWMEEPVMGRRSGPLSDGKLNEVVNFPILAAEGSIMRLAECAVRDAFPFEFAGKGTGMIHQCHDSIAVEVPLPDGFDPLWKPPHPKERKNNPLPPEIEKARRTLEECMTVTIPGWEVVMTAEGDVGRTLKDI